jgi:hypothetical protein
VLGFLDYGKKQLGLGPIITLTGDRDTDLAVIGSFYSSISGRWPDKTCPIKFKH